MLKLFIIFFMSSFLFSSSTYVEKNKISFKEQLIKEILAEMKKDKKILFKSTKEVKIKSE